MRITGVELAVPDPGATASWYADVLGLPTDGATVTVGATVLMLVAGDPGGHHHLAVAIPADAVTAALAWLSGRADLLAPDPAHPVIDGPRAWDSQSVYFRGPDDAVLEVIARHRRRERHAGPFGPAALLEVSEVGLPVDDVPATVAALGRELAVPPFGTPQPLFAPVGGDDGLLIVVAADRAWFPTAGDLPATGPLTVEVATGHPGRLELPGSRVVRSR